MMNQNISSKKKSENLPSSLSKRQNVPVRDRDPLNEHEIPIKIKGSLPQKMAKTKIFREDFLQSDNQPKMKSLHLESIEPVPILDLP